MTHVIVKYSNRKMYSKTLNSYITLSKVMELIKSNESIEVVDYSTKENITSSVLASVVSELNLSTEVLTALIKNA